MTLEEEKKQSRKWCFVVHLVSWLSGIAMKINESNMIECGQTSKQTRKKTITKTVIHEIGIVKINKLHSIEWS